MTPVFDTDEGNVKNLLAKTLFAKAFGVRSELFSALGSNGWRTYRASAAWLVTP